jgi:hypothetical protein
MLIIFLWPAPSSGTSSYFVMPTLGKYLVRLKWKDTGDKISFLAKISLTGFCCTWTCADHHRGRKDRCDSMANPVKLTQVSTSIHDIVAALFVPLLVILIILELTVSPHRKLLISWFTGTISVKTSPPSEPDKG